MRTIVVATALFSLAACDSGSLVDQTIRHGVRQSAVEACVAWVPQSDIALAAGLDPGRLCGCAADHLLEGKNAPELGNLTSGNVEIRTAVAQCVAQVQRQPGRAEPG